MQGAPGETEPKDPSDPAFARSLFEALVRGTRASNALPQTGDLATAMPTYKAAMQGLSARLTNMLQGFMDAPASYPPGGIGADDVSAHYSPVAALSDRLLEKIDFLVDRHDAAAAAAVPAADSLLHVGAPASSVETTMAGGGATRPQHRWRDEVRLQPPTPRLQLPTPRLQPPTLACKPHPRLQAPPSPATPTLACNPHPRLGCEVLADGSAAHRTDRCAPHVADRQLVAAVRAEAVRQAECHRPDGSEHGGE